MGLLFKRRAARAARAALTNACGREPEPVAYEVEDKAANFERIKQAWIPEPGEHLVTVNKMVAAEQIHPTNLHVLVADLDTKAPKKKGGKKK